MSRDMVQFCARGESCWVKGELSNERLGVPCRSDDEMENYERWWFETTNTEVDQTLLVTPACSAEEKTVQVPGWMEDFDRLNGPQVHVG